ncbi:MAG: T9SS type A sorting domain-containing protein, partial [Sediminibacterium sp.]
IHPNPTSKFIQLNINKSYEIQLYNLTGQIIFSKKANPNEQIDVSSINSGIYISKISYDQKTSYQKIIIIK